MGLSISGLVSGLDVPTIVSQLMASEQIPQQMLQNQLAMVQTQASTYRAINTKFQALLTAAQAMTNSATWSATTATSSDPSVTVDSTGTAPAGSLTFTVQSVAQGESVMTSGTPYASATAAYANSTIQFAQNGTTTSIAVGGTGTLSDAANAINNAKLGVTASVVQVGTNQYQLEVNSNTTGAASAFTLDGGTGWQTLTTAQNATLQVGITNPYTVTSATNTITGLMPGVTMTVSQKTSSPVTVNVVSDPQSVGDKMKALIDAANAAITEISKDTDTGLGSTSGSGQAGPLAGDYTVQNLAQRVRSIVSSAVGSLGSPAQIGVQLNSSGGSVDGTIQFDESTFVNALKSNPSMVQSMVDGSSGTPGIAAQLSTLATGATDSVTGTLVTLANGEDSEAKNLQGQIDDWTVRLQATQQQLTSQYNSLQTMLGSLQNQQSWLSSMFGTLGSSSSSSSTSSSSAG